MLGVQGKISLVRWHLNRSLKKIYSFWKSGLYTLSWEENSELKINSILRENLEGTKFLLGVVVCGPQQGLSIHSEGSHHKVLRTSDMHLKGSRWQVSWEQPVRRKDNEETRGATAVMQAEHGGRVRYFQSPKKLFHIPTTQCQALTSCFLKCYHNILESILKLRSYLVMNH